MAATLEDIRRWFNDGKNDPDVTHMIVVCDTFDWDDYPVYVKKHEKVDDKIIHYRNASMQKIMEVYSMQKPFDNQTTSAIGRCWDLT